MNWASHTCVARINHSGFAAPMLPASPHGWCAFEASGATALNDNNRCVRCTCTDRAPESKRDAAYSTAQSLRWQSYRSREELESSLMTRQNTADRQGPAVHHRRGNRAVTLQSRRFLASPHLQEHSLICEKLFHIFCVNYIDYFNFNTD